MVVRRVDGALRIGADDQDLGLALLEVAPHPADRPPGADGDDEGVDLAFGLLPDLGARRLVVGVGVRHVRVLVGLEAPRNLFRKPRGDRVVALGRVRFDGGRCDHDLGTVGPQHRDLLLAHLVRHDEDAAVALQRGRDRKPDAGVARGRLDDRAPRAKLPFALCRLDHRQSDPVLDRTAGVQVLELRQQGGRDLSAEAVESDDRRPTDELEDVRVPARHAARKRNGRGEYLLGDRSPRVTLSGGSGVCL